MGWFDSWFGGESTGADPLAKLDPKLRDYLRRESPIKYTTEDEQQQIDNPPEPAAPKQTQQEQQEADNPPLVPPQSLFPDGRYAHLWKTYRPLAEIEAETKTDHEKLMDVLDAYKGRKAQIGRAALENCADEQMDWAACMKGGDWADRMTMCRKQVQRFERCYMTQSVCFFSFPWFGGGVVDWGTEVAQSAGIPVDVRAAARGGRGDPDARRRYLSEDD